MSDNQSSNLTPVVHEAIREVITYGDVTLEFGGPIDTKLPAFDGSDFYRGKDFRYALWYGTLDEFLEWTKTPWGSMSLYEARKKFRIIVLVFINRAAFELWP